MLNKRNVIVAAFTIVAVVAMLIYSEYPLNKKATATAVDSLPSARQLAWTQAQLIGVPGWHEHIEVHGTINGYALDYEVDSTTITQGNFYSRDGFSYSRVVLGTNHNAVISSLGGRDTFLKADKDFWQATHIPFSLLYVNRWTHISPELLGADIGKLTNVFDIARSIYDPGKSFTTVDDNKFIQGSRTISISNTNSDVDNINIVTDNNNIKIIQTLTPANQKELLDIVDEVSKIIGFFRWAPDQRYITKVSYLQFNTCVQGRRCSISVAASLNSPSLPAISGIHSSVIFFDFIRDEGKIGFCRARNVIFKNSTTAKVSCSTFYHWPPLNYGKKPIYNPSDNYQSPDQVGGLNRQPLPPQNPSIPLPEVKYSSTTYSGSTITKNNMGFFARSLKDSVVQRQRKLPDNEIVYQYSQSMTKKQKIIYSTFGLATSYVIPQGNKYDAKIGANRLVTLLLASDFSKVDGFTIGKELTNISAKTPPGYINEILVEPRLIRIVSQTIFRISRHSKNKHNFVLIPAVIA